MTTLWAQLISDTSDRNVTTSALSNYLTFSDNTTSATSSGIGLYRSYAATIQQTNLYQPQPQSLRNIALEKGTASKIKLPDGTLIDLAPDGSFKIIDKDARTVYGANRFREFNRFVNASDVLSAFIEDIGRLGVRQSDALAVPVELFVYWLVHKAAEQDGDPPPEGSFRERARKILALPPVRPRCRLCGRFLSDLKVTNQVFFCNDHHLMVFMRRKGLA